MDEPSGPALTIGPDLLWDSGFRSLTKAQVTDLLHEVYDTLEYRVGNRLAEGLDDNQLSRFERIVAGRDEASALKWLQEVRPGYREVVASELDFIIGSLSEAGRIRLGHNTRTSLEVPPSGEGSPEGGSRAGE